MSKVGGTVFATGMVTAIVFILIAEVPFLAIGESAAYFWMKWNAPLSWFAKREFDLTLDTWHIHGSVVLINAACWGGIMATLSFLAIKARKSWLGTRQAR